MATLVPSLNCCLARMQAGEKRFARRLEQLLEDDYLCWYEATVGSRLRYTDFIVLHPARGLLLLEVKDWKPETIRRLDRVSAEILTPRGLKAVANPLEQVRQCAYQLVDRLQADPQLVVAAGRYQGRLTFPYGFGVVFPSMTRRQFDDGDLGAVLPPHRVICRDEMTESVDAESFQRRLWEMFDVSFGERLSLPQIDRLRWHLFPEIRVGDGQGSLFADETREPDQTAVIPDIMRVMDLQQEQLARSLGEGHRVIHGVAGSGKTMILGFRCFQLAEMLNKPILVLCFNIALAARLRGMMAERGLGGRVDVFHFHDWCGEQIRRYHLIRPAQGPAYAERLVAAVVSGVEAGRVPRAQYGAVLIDEGHDFEADWLKLVVQMVDPETNSLLLLYDDAQSIYKKKDQLDFSLSSVGIQARGRTTVLKLNYRNTNEVLTFAYRFLSHYLRPTETDDDGIPLIEPKTAGRHGPPPYLKRLSSFAEEARYIAAQFERLHEAGTAWRDMSVIYRAHWMGKDLEGVFSDRGIPVQCLSSGQSKRLFDADHDSVKLMTMHSSKGLEFPVVAVAGLGRLPTEREDEAAEAKLLYVAMTRSTEKLLLTCDRESSFVSRLAAA